MLHLHQLAYGHPNEPFLLTDINLSLPSGLTGLTGPNGSGKSTLLRLIAGQLPPVMGKIACQVTPYYIPQHYGQFDHLTVAEVLGIQPALSALHEILQGNTDPHNFELLSDQWDLEERLKKALDKWGLNSGDLENSDQVRSDTRLCALSGGMKTKVLLSGLSLHNPTLILLDEPTNHLDGTSRNKLYQYLETFKGTALIVSHDRVLLNKMQQILLLDKQGITHYGGGFEFYYEEQAKQQAALDRQLNAKFQALKAAERTKKQAMERKQKQDSRGKQKQQKAGLPTILQNSLQVKAENSRADLMDRHDKKLSGLKTDMEELRHQQKQKQQDTMRLAVENSNRPMGKILLDVRQLNFSYGHLVKGTLEAHAVWPIPLNFKLPSGIRCVITGENGSGKSTLFALIQGKFLPATGEISKWSSQTKQIEKQHLQQGRDGLHIMALDQDYTLIQNSLTVYQQAMVYKSPETLPDTVHIVLSRFLFTPDYWQRPCHALSGGERMRLALCCLQLQKQAPDILILDEPTNNLDLAHLEILTAAIKSYKGILLVSSHDQQFLQEIEMTHRLLITKGGKIEFFTP